MKVICDECGSVVDKDVDFSMVLLLDKGLETERELCFCSMLCATTWVNKQEDGEDEE